MAREKYRIPEFRPDGYLPEGLFQASKAEVTFRFGSSSRRRRRLVLRVRAPRLLIDGGFVTAKHEPDDVDAVVLLPPDFMDLIAMNSDAALVLEEMLLTRRPEELFAAEDDDDWNEWVEFFSRTREADARRKGLVEIEL